jgi:hypothetical protein
MSFQNASEKSPPPISRPRQAEVAPVRFDHRPRPLAVLGARQCRYCVQDTTKGRMDQALFCAAPTTHRAYCATHAELCRAAETIDVEALLVEIAIASQFLDPA